MKEVVIKYKLKKNNWNVKLNNKFVASVLSLLTTVLPHFPSLLAFAHKTGCTSCFGLHVCV